MPEDRCAQRLLVVRRCAKKDCPTLADQVMAVLELDAAQKEQVIVRPGSAKEFLETPSLAESLVELIPPSKDVPF